MSEPSPPQNGTSLSTGPNTWFDQMTGYLKWKILGPDINNPFKPAVPLHTLNRMATQRDFLSQHISIRCMCDGYEVMMIINPNQPRIVSSHPCISRMDRADIVDYIRRAQLDEVIDTEIDRIEEEIRGHLSSRSFESEESSDYLGKKKKSAVAIAASKSKEKDESRSKNFRIVKR